MSDGMTIIVNAKAQDVTPVSVKIQDRSCVKATMNIDQPVRTGVAESFDAIYHLRSMWKKMWKRLRS